MSDSVLPGAAGAEGPSAGTQLRQAREAAGMHVETLAVLLKVPVRKLEALEADRYDQLSDTVFVRGLAASVCRTLKIDAQPVLARLPQRGRPRLVQTSEGINAPFRAPGDERQAGWADQLTRPVGLAVLALLLGALVIILLPNVRQDTGASLPREPAPAPAPAPAVAPAPTGVLLQPPESSAQAAPAAAPAALATPASAAQPVTAADAPATAAADGALVHAGTGVVVFRARAPSWVQVTDARGNSVLRRLMEAGETMSASGTPPLLVTVGSAQSTEVQVQGKPFDLSPVTRDNVARFEVK